MEFHLQDCRSDPRHREQVADQGDRRVAQADPSDEAGRHEVFHRPPGVGQRHGDRLHAGFAGSRIVDPCGRVASLEGNVLQRDRKVHEIEIEMVEPEIAERPLDRRPHMLRLVVGVPEFRRDPEVIPAAEPLGQRGADALPRLDLVAIIAGRIDVPITDTDRLLHERRGVWAGDLPEAKSHGRRRIFDGNSRYWHRHGAPSGVISGVIPRILAGWSDVAFRLIVA